MGYTCNVGTLDVISSWISSFAPMLWGMGGTGNSICQSVSCTGEITRGEMRRLSLVNIREMTLQENM